MRASNGTLKILRLILAIRETSAPYNQFSLPWTERHDITICTYFPSDVIVPKTITVSEGDGSLPGFFRALKAALSLKEYDVVHAHSPHVGLLFLIGTLFSYWKYASSTVITVHDSYPNYKLRNRLMFIPAFACFQRVVCCSRASYESFPAFYKRLAGNRLRFVRNGLDIARVDRLAANIPQGQPEVGEFVVVAVSRLVNIKNPFSVLAAFGQTSDPASRLVYIGDGPLRPLLLAKSKEANLEDRVQFTGQVSRESVFEILFNADLFISMSRGEGLPVAVLEAMACGCPVLLSDIPPHREIAEGVDFIPLIRPDDAPGFAREIERFRGMPVSARRSLGKKCRKLVEERFSLPAMQAGYEEIYAQITSASALSSLKAEAFKDDRI